MYEPGRASADRDGGEELLAAARERVREEIRQLRDRATDEALKEFLARLEERAFEPKLRVSALVRRHLKGRAAPRREIAELTELSPAAWLTEVKLVETFRLVCETDLEIWRIAELTGLNTTYFSAKFGARFGRTARQVRKEHRAAAPRRPVPAATAEPTDEGGPVLELLPAPAAVARHAAEIVWRAWRDRPVGELRALVAASRFHTREFIDLLGEEYLVASRVDRQRGVEIAELAVLAVETSAAELGKAAADLLAQAWVWTANARRLALDHPGAEAALAQAENVWEAPRSGPDRAVRAMMLGIKADLRYFQRRFEEALGILDEAIKESRLARAPRLEAQALILRAAVIDYGRLGRPTVPTLKQALHVLRPLDEPRLTLGTQMNLSYVYAAAGEYRSALDQVAEAWSLWEELPVRERDRVIPAQLQWHEALARQGLGELETAERLYEDSHGALVEAGEVERSAIVALDLARLCRAQGRASEVLRLASEALPVLEALEVPEAEEALALLRRALEESAVTAALLEAVRSTLVRLQRILLPAAARA